MVFGMPPEPLNQSNTCDKSINNWKEIILEFRLVPDKAWSSEHYHEIRPWCFCLVHSIMVVRRIMGASLLCSKFVSCLVDRSWGCENKHTHTHTHTHIFRKRNWQRHLRNINNVSENKEPKRQPRRPKACFEICQWILVTQEAYPLLSKKIQEL